MRNVSGPDYKEITRRITGFIRSCVEAAGAGGVVFGLSGGIDSAVVAHLCSAALGPERCSALVMPAGGITPSSETDDGVLVATALGMEYRIRPIGPMVEAFVASDADGFSGDSQKAYVIGNLSARIRASCLYYEGQKSGRLVVGTDDKSEYMIGYFTKYGDGASDMLPIANLYKSQVWELAGHLGVPEHIIAKKPSPHLWPGHSAHDELGMEYGTIDGILAGIYEAGEDPAALAARLGIPEKDVKRITSLVEKSGHKRRLPPTVDPYAAGGEP